MRKLEAEYLLVHSLSQSEKRQVKLLGNTLGGKRGSSHLRLFDLLNQMDQYDQDYIVLNPFLRSLGKGLSTVASRLRSMISTSVFGHQSRTGLNGKLSLALFEGEFFLQRKQTTLAGFVINKGIRLARKFGKYAESLALLDLKRRVVLLDTQSEKIAELDLILKMAREDRVFLEVQQELAHLHATVIAGTQKGLAPRKEEDAKAIRELVEEAAVLRKKMGPDLMSLSLVHDMEGLLLIVSGRGGDALKVYEDLLGKWRSKSDWVSESPHFYLDLFRHYQRSIYFGTTDPKVMESYLRNLPTLDSFPATFRLDFQRINYSHQLTLGLNQGKFGAVFHLAPLVLTWLQKNGKDLGEGLKLAFHYNLTIAYFLAGEFSEAYRLLQHILAWKKGPSRQDIRDFSKVLEVILLYELRDIDLNEYVARRNKRYFDQQGHQNTFEKAVVMYISKAMRSVSPEKNSQEAEKELSEQLVTLIAETSRPAPMLGLFETQIWLQSRQSGRSIKEVFLQIIREV